MRIRVAAAGMGSAICLLISVGGLVTVAGGWTMPSEERLQLDNSAETDGGDNSSGSNNSQDESQSGNAQDGKYVSVLVLREEDERLVAVFTEIKNEEIVPDKKGISSFTYTRLGRSVHTTERVIRGIFSFDQGEDELVQIDAIDDDGNWTVADWVSKRMIFPAIDGSSAIYVYLVGSSEDKMIENERGEIDRNKALRRIDRWEISPYEEKVEEEVHSERRG